MNILNDTVVKGQITGNSIVKEGGTGMQVLMADGETKEQGEMYCYGICSTAASTQAKVVSMNAFVLKTYIKVCVKFTYANTASSPTMNINSTGAKTIRYNNSNISSGQIKANHIYEFVYDGTYWQLVGDLDTNTDTKVTSVSNHYTPSANSSSQLTVSSGNYISAIQRDAKGHVTGIVQSTLPTPSSTSSTVDKTIVISGSGSYTSAAEAFLNNKSNITTALSQGITCIELSCDAGAQDYFRYLCPDTATDFASVVDTFAALIYNNCTNFPAEEYKLHFNIYGSIAKNNTWKQITSDIITSSGSTPITNGSLTRLLALYNSNYSALGVDVEITFRPIRTIRTGVFYIHYDITPIIV